MRRLTVTLLAFGLVDIANAHSLDRGHELVDALWHQVIGSHHLPFSIGLMVGGAVLFVIGRWISTHRGR